ncbi:bacterio-opsin activator domain-containing protein [Halomicroarcula sp. GCM10025709]|uniref:bacterio-opsin activator domain-containing protein n=1 Tax=Haloarcula TaxID=2237 RepID=UPI0024C31B02|nr:bacterio-opsin activator domain-containing protein [Halomicroarcula sp. YJ-61-S]
MRASQTLARSTLDTLPMNIAVVDRDGTILFTNRAWREFAGVEDEEIRGVNYFETTDVEADEYAQAAVDGIKSVIAGEKELFTLEYPCHTPDQQQWFLMRVAPLPPEEAGSVVIAHIDITQRKLAELAAERRSAQLDAQRQDLEHLLSRIDGLVHSVLDDVMSADSRAEVERTICDRLETVDSYRVARIASFDIRRETLELTAGDDTAGTIPLDAADPVATAARRREIQTVTGQFEDTHAAIAGPESGSLAAVPLASGESLYGVLTVYADSSDVFDPRERAILGVIGQAASKAIDAIETSRILTADNVTELELLVTDEETFFVAVATELDCRLEYGGSVADHEETVMFFTVSTDDPSAVCAVAADHPEVTAVTHVSSSGDTSLFEFTVDDPPVVSLLADRGAETRDIVVEPGRAEVTATLSAETETRAVVEHVRDHYAETELLSVRERDEPPTTREAFLTSVEDNLTNRQLTALRKGYLGGFFEWPRDVAGDELAASMDITPSTFHQHLRAGERKLLAAVFDAR